ncbi:hypothetical protein NBRC116583_18020 [Arenicella sp. 4NH20-0111]|uniref:hypothetical protein n=1 Tax=Arenicella sp. 4NH20-0111 TaxID=3127648 RepID=UPI003108B5E9
MIVPDFWAEARRQEKINGSQVTLKRFGWSNESYEHALENAKQRVNEAMTRALSGEKVRKVDHKISYNGGEGLPIREEVVARHEDVVITRNTYGALCLNTPDVLFADVDLNIEPSGKLLFGAGFMLTVFAVAAGMSTSSWWLFFISLFVAMIFSSALAGLFLKLSYLVKGAPETQFRLALEEFVSTSKDANLRLYKTPNGFRVLAMHDLFDPQGEDAKRLFSNLMADKLYVQMCLNQNCFRARVSPKPWRINIKRMGPRPGTWPIKEDRMFARQLWVNAYQNASKGYASCVFDSSHGSDIVHPKAKLVMELHDEYSRSDTELAIA